MKNLILLPIMAMLALSGTARADKEYSFDKKSDFDGNQVKSISIDIPSGDLLIEKSSDSKVDIQFKNIIQAGSREAAENLDSKCDYDATLNGDELKIDVNLPRRNDGRDFFGKLFSGNWKEEIHMMVKLTIPDGKSVTIRTSSADIEADGLVADLDVRGSSSDIELRDTEGGVFLDLSSGDVDVTRHKGSINIVGKSSDCRLSGISGDADIRTSSGDNRLEDIGGSLKVETSSGDCKIYNVEGDLDIRTSSGDAYVNGVSGSVRAESSSGDIQLNALSADEGDFEADSQSGDILIEVSPQFSGRLNLRSSSGSIDSQISGDIERISNSRLITSVGKGMGQVKVATTSGDIKVLRY